MAPNRACWDDMTTKTFMDLCIAEKNRFNGNHKGLTNHGWQNVYSNFKQQTGQTFDSKQMQNKLAGMRRGYIQWRDLQNQTGLGRDKHTDGVAADDSFWETEQETNDEAATRGKLPPKFLEEL
ncbi:hypothetical protein BS78_03G417000 [Paspalum vaginatum]|nr:hypothetical protein BS78_03G417000 [Paspalum vaginatum]